MRDCKGSEVVSDILVARYKGYKVASPFGEAFFVLASGSMGEPAYLKLVSANFYLGTSPVLDRWAA